MLHQNHKNFSFHQDIILFAPKSKKCLNDSLVILNNKHFGINFLLLYCISQKISLMEKIANILTISVEQSAFPCFASFLLRFRGFGFNFLNYDLDNLT